MFQIISRDRYNIKKIISYTLIKFFLLLCNSLYCYFLLFTPFIPIVFLSIIILIIPFFLFVISKISLQISIIILQLAKGMWASFAIWSIPMRTDFCSDYAWSWSAIHICINTYNNLIARAYAIWSYEPMYGVRGYNIIMGNRNAFMRAEDRGVGECDYS